MTAVRQSQKTVIGDQRRLHAIIIVETLGEIDVVTRVDGQTGAERDAGNELVRFCRRAEAGAEPDGIAAERILAGAVSGSAQIRFRQYGGGERSNTVRRTEGGKAGRQAHFRGAGLACEGNKTGRGKCDLKTAVHTQS